jgi:hypothetical protein
MFVADEMVILMSVVLGTAGVIASFLVLGLGGVSLRVGQTTSFAISRPEIFMTGAYVHLPCDDTESSILIKEKTTAKIAETGKRACTFHT